ncbi:Zn-ribbon domain-containing OB-fold protein [Amycolatopsis thermoflava]|uniref:Zn-ribbon domain-containing OB-fold protein n=1 Tax=Amycolatopsis thermoflava TaxID=84480 RepID=UPI00381295BF
MTVPGSYGGAGLTDEFWAAAAQHRLVRPVCRACGSSFFPPLIACPHCVSEDWEYRPSSGRGTIYSCTVVHKAPSPEFEVPFSLAIVDLDDEGWGMLTTIVGTAERRCPEIGSAVEVTWRQAGGRTLPAFRPVGAR